MSEVIARNRRADLVAAIVLVWAMLLAAWPPSAGVLVAVQELLGSLAGASGQSPPPPAWAWPIEALMIGVAGLGVMLWGRGQPPATTLALAAAAALALLGLDVVLRTAGVGPLQLVAPALTAIAAAGLCVAMGERRGDTDSGADTRAPAPRVAAAAVRKAPDLGGNTASSGNAALRRAGEALRSGDFAMAWASLRNAPLAREDFETLYSIAVGLQRQGQRAEALAAFERLRDRDPDYRDVAARLRDLERLASGGRTAAPTPAAKPAGDGPRTSNSGLTGEPVKLIEGQVARLGRYELVRELGRGAMGVVYLGRDPRINRVVAIKAIPLAEEFEAEDVQEAKARFFREAETAGRLNHPNIVTIYDVGEEHELAYIAMEYLEGTHLSGHVKPETLLPMPVVVDLVARVADALGYAHRENVVHRDIKPANIMYDRAADTLKITDFGIARLTDSSRTRTGIVLGTPSFMSPEQLEGKQVTGQSDLFSLGVTFYQMLTGQLPFRGSSMPKLMFAIANLAHAPVTHVRPELSADLDRIMDLALAKDPRERFETGAHMAQALRAFTARLGR
ncbi:MAG: serine/threonine protein kinase [Gammaproteobacteria bacterium]|nr:MAG: serine/threonine protein kinase [Gammaproteobacteria bacterium]